jgi:hypothetical protein
MQNSHVKLMATVLLTCTSFASSLALAQNDHAKNPKVTAAPWSSLPLGSCEVQIESSAYVEHAFVYCQGAPKIASMGVFEHNNANTSVAALSAAECHASLNGKKIICFGGGLADNGVSIPNVIVIPAAKSCDSLNWAADAQGEMNLVGTGCRFNNGSKNPNSSSITLSDYMYVSHAHPNPRINNNDGDLSTQGSVGDIVD